LQKHASSLSSIGVKHIHHHTSNSQSRAKCQSFVHGFTPFVFVQPSKNSHFSIHWTSNYIDFYRKRNANRGSGSVANFMYGPTNANAAMKRWQPVCILPIQNHETGFD
jgi:hypothetical protein